MLGRHAAVFRAAHHLRFNLLFDRGDADHEELVEIRPKDCDELQALEERRTPVESFFQHAIVELEPRKLPAEE